MKTLVFIVITLSVIFSVSCKKDPEIIYKDVEHKDTVFYSRRDTVFFVEKNDSIQVGFVYTLSYPVDSSTCSLKAVSNCKSLPSNAVYNWSIDGDLATETLKTYFNVGFTYTHRGNHVLSLNIYIPDKKKNYTTSEVFTVKTKKP